ncbi:DNA/RNA non-specific endonuclease [Chondrocystis sp. NIES-4102]|nr:DNA/RNA non-specific endonuclease [Chondrocystis sp. NIES-4102]
MIVKYKVIILIIIIWLTGCSQPAIYNIHLQYGNPSGANDNYNNYLIERPAYALSYNCQAGIPNWVSWELDSSWLGNLARSDNFRPDSDLPPDCYAVRPLDYRGTGYDRGHLIPSGDRTQNSVDNSDTFLMSNMIPQSPANNREVWRELEEYSRTLAKSGNKLYLIAGGNGIAEKIAQSKVVVPQYTWKVILVVKPDTKLTVNNAYTIAVWIPNSEQVKNTKWQDYLVSVEEVEKRTGYNFFDQLPKSIQAQIETTQYLVSTR